MQLLSANEKDRIFRCVQSLQIKPSGSGDENEFKMTSSSCVATQPCGHALPCKNLDGTVFIPGR